MKHLDWDRARRDRLLERDAADPGPSSREGRIRAELVSLANDLLRCHHTHSNRYRRIRARAEELEIQLKIIGSTNNSTTNGGRASHSGSWATSRG